MALIGIVFENKETHTPRLFGLSMKNLGSMELFDLIDRGETFDE